MESNSSLQSKNRGKLDLKSMTCNSFFCLFHRFFIVLERSLLHLFLLNRSKSVLIIIFPSSQSGGGRHTEATTILANNRNRKKRAGERRRKAIVACGTHTRREKGEKKAASVQTKEEGSFGKYVFFSLFLSLLLSFFPFPRRLQRGAVTRELFLSTLFILPKHTRGKYRTL